MRSDKYNKIVLAEHNRRNARGCNTCDYYVECISNEQFSILFILCFFFLVRKMIGKRNCYELFFSE